MSSNRSHLPLLQTDLLLPHVSERDRLAFSPGPHLVETTAQDSKVREANDEPGSDSILLADTDGLEEQDLKPGSIITIGVNDGRLRKAEVEALNLYLAKYAGQFQGHPLFRISWAADDNYGLLRSHLSTCPKRDPGDFDCCCPIDPNPHIPICFHPSQACYHLLSWQPPTGDEVVVAEIVGSKSREQARQAQEDGSYSCVMHFCDPHTGVPFSPTQYVVESLVPIFREEAKRHLASLHGDYAVLMRERARRANGIAEQRAKEAHDYDVRADQVLEDAEPAFGGIPFSGSTYSAGLTALDARKEGAERPAPTLEGPAMTFRMPKKQI